jgi:hypothetical protein
VRAECPRHRDWAMPGARAATVNRRGPRHARPRRARIWLDASIPLAGRSAEQRSAAAVGPGAGRPQPPAACQSRSRRHAPTPEISFGTMRQRHSAPQHEHGRGRRLPVTRPGLLRRTLRQHRPERVIGSSAPGIRRSTVWAISSDPIFAGLTRRPSETGSETWVDERDD